MKPPPYRYLRMIFIWFSINIIFKSLFLKCKLYIFRQEVIQMIEEGKKKQAKLPKFKYNTGLSYYPFQK